MTRQKCITFLWGFGLQTSQIVDQCTTTRLPRVEWLCNCKSWIRSYGIFLVNVLVSHHPRDKAASKNSPALRNKFSCIRWGGDDWWGVPSLSIGFGNIAMLPTTCYYHTLSRAMIRHRSILFFGPCLKLVNCFCFRSAVSRHRCTLSLSLVIKSKRTFFSSE